MKVRFYQFAKRNKSTKVPDSQASYQELDCNLKDFTSMLKPVFLIQTLNPAAYCYMYVPNWNRYYFITDVTFNDGMYEVAGTIDVLGTYKTEIGATSCNIVYATGSTKDIADARIPVKASLSHSYTSASMGFNMSYANTRTILGITGKGSFGCYILENESDLPEILDGIDSWSQFITDNWEFTKQLFFGGSASECLRSAVGIPIAFSKSAHGTLEQLSLGNYPCEDANGNPIKGYKITDPILDYGGNISIPWIHSNWQNVSGYTDVLLYLPLIGLLSMPASELRNEINLLITYKINITSGDICVEVTGQTTLKKYATCSGNCAMPVAFGSTGIDTNKVTQAAITGIGTLVAINAATGGGGSLAAMLKGFEGGELIGNAAVGAGLLTTAMQTMQALGGSASGSAGLGGGAACAMDDTAYCFVVSKDLTDTQDHFDPIMGKPFMGVSTPNQFSGYVQTDGFQFQSIQAYSSEKDKINQLMDSGVYFE